MRKHNTKLFFLLCSISAVKNKITRTGSCLGQGFDHVHQPVSGSNVHTTVLIGQTSVGDNWSALTELWQSVISCWSTAAVTVRLMKEAENQSGIPHCELDQLQENLISWRWKFIHAERRTRTQFIIQIHDIQQRSEQKHNRIFNHTHTCAVSGERWLGDRCRACTLRLGSQLPPPPDWLPAGPAPETTSLPWQSRPARRWRPRLLPSRLYRHGKSAAPCPEPGTTLRRTRGVTLTVPSTITCTHSIYPKNLDVVFSVKHLQKLMHYIYNFIIFCNKVCIFLFWITD